MICSHFVDITIFYLLFANLLHCTSFAHHFFPLSSQIASRIIYISTIPHGCIHYLSLTLISKRKFTTANWICIRVLFVLLLKSKSFFLNQRNTMWNLIFEKKNLCKRELSFWILRYEECNISGINFSWLSMVCLHFFSIPWYKTAIECILHFLLLAINDKVECSTKTSQSYKCKITWN